MKKLLLFIAVGLMACGNDPKQPEKEGGEATYDFDFEGVKDDLQPTFGNNVKYKEEDGLFAIDQSESCGGMLVEVELAKELSELAPPNRRGRIEQTRHTYVMGITQAAGVKVYVQPYVNQAWKDAIYYAVNLWNNSGSNIKVTLNQTYNGSNLVVDTFYNANTGTIAYAYLPWSNEVGPSMYMNEAFIGRLSQAQLNMAAAHEMGHNFGFRHSHEEANIPGTDANDVNSIMWPSVHSSPQLTPNDLVATRYLWPKQTTEPTPTPTPTPVPNDTPVVEPTPTEPTPVPTKPRKPRKPTPGRWK